jgi:hypothetical protein
MGTSSIIQMAYICHSLDIRIDLILDFPDPLSPILPNRGNNQAKKIETNNLKQVQGNPLLQMKH